MPIFTSFEIKKHVTQIRISKMAALEKRSAIKFCVASKKSRQETFEMIKTAFRNNAMKKTALYCINDLVSLSEAIILLLMNRG